MRTLILTIASSLFCIYTFAQLPPPTAFQASNVTTNSFTAQWSSVSGALAYRLDVSTVSNFASFVSGYNNLQVGSEFTTQHNVSGLSPNTTYWYRVRAENSGG